MTERVYIHEFIDIVGHHRADYVHHMTANWAPTAWEQRRQRCYGVWALLGSTGRWPQTVNMWEHEGWDGLADNFAHEAVGRGAQDPALEKWWARAADFRRGGLDRLMVATPWSRPIERLCADGVRGDVYAHELVAVRPGAADDLLAAAHETGAPILGRYGWQLIGGFRTALADDDEALLLWAIPTWRDWAAGERAHATDDDLRRWRSDRRELVTGWHRVLLVDSPLNPMRIGRQPSRADRTDWVD